MKILITGGGTGGHIYPALAIAEQLKKNNPRTDILYVGSIDGMEKDLVPQKGFTYVGIETAPLNKKFSFKTIKNLVPLVKGFFQARKIIKNYKPNVIVGTGGYVSGSVVLAGALRGIPTAIHEQNAIPGMTNKLLSRFVDVVMLSFDEAKSFIKQKEKIVYTGLPILEAFFTASYEESRKKLNIPPETLFVLSVGGSNGAMHLNEIVLKAYAEIGNDPDYHFAHVSGKRYYPYIMEDIENGDLQKNQNVQLLPYLKDMPTYLAAADIVISRAGASTLNEIIASRTPSVIIPSPNVSNNHQFYNAQVIDKFGMGVVIQESDLSPEIIVHIIEDLKNEPSKLAIMRKNCEQIDLRKSLESITQTLIRTAKIKRGRH